MAAEVLAGLQPRSGGCYVDGTVGGGGHAAALLEASSPAGRLFGCDRDEEALTAATARLTAYSGRFELQQGDFAELDLWLGPESCDGVLLDLGTSSYQLDSPERGFSFLRDGPLDMRLDRGQATTAADLVNTADAEELARIFREYGGERDARRLARGIERERQTGRIETTGRLAGLIERLCPRRGRRTHPATQVFQALRIVVNDEITSLRRGLAAAARILRPGGRLAVITFHSLEDRVVKEFGRDQTRDYTIDGDADVPELRRPRPPEMTWVQRKAVRPGGAELAANPRSRSAQLRILQKA